MPGRARKCISIVMPVIVMVLSCFFNGSRGQHNNYTIVPFTPVNGLVSSDISSIYQDRGKRLWIAHSAGISNYDGYEFKNYLFSQETRLGRGYTIREDFRFGYLIGAETGLFILSDEKMRYIPFTGKPVPVYAFVPGKSGGIWMATSDGPAYFNLAQFTDAINTGSIDLQKHILPVWKKMFPLTNTARNIVGDDSGRVYITDGYSIYTLVNDSLVLLWKSVVQADMITGMAVMGNGKLYFSTVFTGVHQLDKSALYRYTGDYGNGNGVCIRNGLVYYFATTGIYQLETQKRVLIPEVLLPSQFWEWGSFVFKDSENNFWIGTHEKLLHARKRLFSDLIQPGLEGFEEIYSIFEMQNGDLYLGGNHGRLYKKHFGDSRFIFQEKIFERSAVSDILQDADGNTWFGSGFQGIAVKRNNRLDVFTRQQGLRDNTNLFLLYTKSKQLYAAGDNGVSRINNMAAPLPLFKNWQTNSGSNNYAIIKTGIEKPGGGLLFGSNYGLFELLHDSLRAYHIEGATRRNYFVTAIKQDTKQNIWISTIGDGLLICKFTNTGSLKLIRQLTEADGLSSMLFLHMIVDKDDVTWAISYSGITRIEKSGSNDYGVTNFTATHGFINDNYHSAKLFQDKQGIIWIVTSSGLFKFHPYNALQFMNTSPVTISQASFGKGNHSETYVVDSNQALGNPRGPELAHNKNDVSFDFNSINLSEPLSTKYRYRLVGLDSNWADAGKNRRASFRNLPPGEYLFEVKASNGTNRWSKAAGFAYIIKPPFWTTWWFIAVIALGLCLGIFYLLRRRVRSIKKTEREKTEIQKLKAVSYQYQLEIEQVINYFATSISEQKNVEDILWDVARNCISKLGFEDCVIYLIDTGRNVLVQKAAWGPKTTNENKILNPIDIPLGHGIVGTVAETGKPLIISDTSADPRYILDDALRFSEITVPIVNEGRILGVIDSEYPEKNFYTTRHLHILTTIASLCADKMAKVKSAQQAMEKEVQVFKLNQDLATSQLTALRSQMNPHFIFNSLNSIAQLVASKKNDEGLEYLNKFSKLMRLVLDESSNNLISLKDEIRMIDLYLQLETLRFGSSFSHSINVGQGLEEEDTFLPSFIIHPIVENAVWHGLLHKEGARRLIIEFVKEGAEQLFCIVKDNGIGIKAAREKKVEQLKGETQESKGLQIIRDRLELLRKQYKINTSITLEDLQENDIITGTKVTILLPVVYD